MTLWASVSSVACSSSSPGQPAANDAGGGVGGGQIGVATGGTSAAGGISGANGGASGAGGTIGTSGASGTSGGGTSAAGGWGGAGGNGGAPEFPPSPDGGAPVGFWDTSGIPAAKNVLMFKFLNRTNGKFADGEVYWSFKNGNVNETHSIADQPLYDMPANSSGRVYFYLCAKGGHDVRERPHEE